MLIETASAADIPALSALLAELFSQEQEFTPDSAAQSRGLLTIINNPDVGIILLARRNGKTGQTGEVVGMLNMLFTVSTALGAPVALLEDMVVSSACRRELVGTRLLTEAISLARDRGCKRITLLTDSANKAAQKFYSRHGFNTSAMLPMRLTLY